MVYRRDRLMAKVNRWAMPTLPAATGLALILTILSFVAPSSPRSVGHTEILASAWGDFSDPRYAPTPPLPNSLLSLSPYNPPNRGAPGRTRDAGSRSCGLVALVPTQTHWGETLEPHPTFWFYVANPAERMIFDLRDEMTGESVFTTEFAALAGPGIGSYVLPDEALALESDRLYRWQLTLDCPRTDSDPTVNSIVVRREVDPELTEQLDNALPEERINLLATHGLWYDTLTDLAQLRASDPQNPELETAWVELLQHPVVALDDMVEMPLIPCCSVENP